MSARSIRRAAERKTRTLARLAAREQQQLSPESSQAPEISAAQLVANRANAVLSTGPRTPEGRATSSLNAVKTGLTGATVLLPTDAAAEYELHLVAFHDEYQPVGLRECELVQSIADTFWRLRRIPILETAIFAKGRIEFAELFNEQDLAARPHLIDAHTFLAYEKQIRNLQLQEARLARRREKEIAEIRKLQAERLSKTGAGEHSAPFAESDACPGFAAPERTGRCAAQQHLLATLVPVVRDPANGFVSSTPEINHAALPPNSYYEPAPLTTAPDSCLLTQNINFNAN